MSENMDKTKERIIALAGNPNVGKSTVFNALTGLRQHTGNWAGKTVISAQGFYEYNRKEYTLIDLPGCYSLRAASAEEEAAREYLQAGVVDVAIVVCDAVCLERNLILVLQILQITSKVVVCVNLMDEASKRRIKIDLEKISNSLGVPVIGTSARSNKGLNDLKEAVERVIVEPPKKTIQVKEDISAIVHTAEEICEKAIAFEDNGYMDRNLKADKILTGKWTAFPIMLIMLLGVFWITIEGAEYICDILSDGLFWIEKELINIFIRVGTPPIIYEILIMGIYRVLAWVVAVMLPPMAIFFPLFTFLEDIGILPRIAFNLDKYFKKCRACGKQALTMCMGFGCNAAGVIGCRIISSPRERLIAIITNNFVPCNGRFPILIAVISMFFIGTASGYKASLLSAGLLTLVIVLGIAMTFIASKILSVTLLKGMPSSFTLELPPYRRPKVISVIVRSIFDRTLFVLGRAVMVAAPAGLIIWIMANTTIGDLTLLTHIAKILDPFAALLGMDGIILLAFLLGFPANEIVIPIIIMAYISQGSLIKIDNLYELKELFTENGWTWITAINVMLFTMMHWPCSTALLTIRKETQSVKWTFISFAVPTLMGMAMCFIFTAMVRMLS